MEEEGSENVRDPDEFVPVDGDEDDADEFIEGTEEAEEEDDGTANVLREASIMTAASDHEIDTSILGTPVHQLQPAPRRTSTPNATGSRSIPKANKTVDKNRPRQRIVEEWGLGGQENRLKTLFGPTHDDLWPVFRTRDKWLFQGTLPSRSAGSLAPSFFLSQGAKERETKSLRDWYTFAGREAFARGQETRELNEDEGKTYMVVNGPDSLNLLMGDIKNQRVYTLKRGSYLSASEPFGSHPRRRGWTLNLGSRIKDAQWATNEQGSTQYLAVAVEQDDPTGYRCKHMENPIAPAFTATKPFPASIQVWAFDSTENGDLDPVKEPRLEQVICTAWGAPRSVRWWPIGAEDSADQIGDGIVRLGLLASIWSDGKVRVLEVSHRKPEAGSPQTRYVYYSNAAFEVGFHDTLPTCLCWLSATSIAVGTASGILAIWTLSRPGMFPSPDIVNPRGFSPQPWFFQEIGNTYIVTLASGYPSRPQFVSITVADGFARLIDLRSPLADSCFSPRGRMFTSTQAWHEHTQSFIMPDEYCMLRHNTTRRYYQSIYTFRTNSAIFACATSLVHPGVLIGTVDGSVGTTNPICKVLNSKDMPWEQIWFKHEWRQVRTIKADATQNLQSINTGNIHGIVTTSELMSNSVSGTSHGLDSQPDLASLLSSQPLVRITEGYKARKIMLGHGTEKLNHDGAKFISVFEQNSAVTNLAWNQNMKFGTWAVAGMHSGLLRVEDIGV